MGHKPKTGNDVFAYKGMTPSGTLSSGSVRKAAAELYDTIQLEVPEGRNKSVALTKLEEAIMWANKGIVHDSTEE